MRRGTFLGIATPKKVIDSSSGYKIDYFIAMKNFLNIEGHKKSIGGSKLSAILLKKWILPSVGVALKGSGPAAYAAVLF